MKSKVFKDLVPGDIVYFIKTYYIEESRGPELIKAPVLKVDDNSDGIFSFDLGEDYGGWHSVLDSAELNSPVVHAHGLNLLYLDHIQAEKDYIQKCKDFLRGNYMYIRSHETKLMELRDLQLKYTKIVDDHENV